MARKHRTGPGGSRSHPRAFDRKESSLKRWEKLSDIPLDEEDRFHAARDRILLDGDDHHSEDEGDEDEIFALKGMPKDSDQSDEEVEGQEDEDEDMDGGSLLTPQIKKPAKSKGKKGKTSALDSDESESESEEEEEAWGRNKSDYYSSNAAQLESDDEEANEMEEQEAKRLQAKARDAMGDDDFGLNDIVEVSVPAEHEDDLEEPTVPILQSLPQDKHSLLRHLEKTSPETLALARDWDDVAHSLVKTETKIAAMEKESSEVVSLGMAHLHYQALLTYATTLAFYLHLRASEKYALDPSLLRAHPIMSRLLTLKQSLATLEDLDFALSDSEEDEDDVYEMDDEETSNLWNMDKMKGLELDELKGLLDEAKEVMAGLMDNKQKNGKNGDDDGDNVRENKDKTKKKQKPAATEDERPKKKRKTQPQPVLPVFDLVEPTFSAKSSRSTHHTSSISISDDIADPYGERATLNAFDALDKTSRTRSLRFHTSKIESGSARRERARNAIGGDDDIPWKARQREKEERRKRELENQKGKLGLGGDDLDDEEPEPREGEKKGKRRREKEDEEDESGGSDEEGAGGYYDLIKKKSRETKEKKKADYEAVQAAARASLASEDSADGPRSLTRAILKNRGLTPHRSKSVRNPRVKKRQRFEKAKKKVASQKAVFKGGISETKGRYDGERTGISKVIKSVRLG